MLVHRRELYAAWLGISKLRRNSNRLANTSFLVEVLSKSDYRYLCNCALRVRWANHFYGLSGCSVIAFSCAHSIDLRYYMVLLFANKLLMRYFFNLLLLNRLLWINNLIIFLSIFVKFVNFTDFSKIRTLGDHATLFWEESFVIKWNSTLLCHALCSTHNFVVHDHQVNLFFVLRTVFAFLRYFRPLSWDWPCIADYQVDRSVSGCVKTVSCILSVLIFVI